MIKPKELIKIYTRNSMGKIAASIYIFLIAAGDDMKSCISQSITKVFYSENKIIDKINETLVYIWFEFINEKQIIELFKIKPYNTEIILTGRYASDNLKKRLIL